jgi:predicted nuclease with TOPRIM domain
MMSEDLTQNLPPRPFEERVLAELAAMRNEFGSELAAIRGDIKRLDEKVDRLEVKVDRLEARFDQLEGRVDALEEKVDRRLQETRPIWEDVQLRLHRLESKFDILLEEHTELRLDQKLIGRRVTLLEGHRTE